MDIIKTPIEGLVEILPKVHNDTRGWFLEVHKPSAFRSVDPNVKFVQDNLSSSKKGVIRGLHLQLPPSPQAKLAAVLQGKVLDIVVDLRKGSHTFGQTHSCILDAHSKRMLYVPEGFAHGFAALEDSVFFYKCSSEYHPERETGIRWNDPTLNLDWKIADPVLSEKDRSLPTLNDLLIKSVISP